jgi:acylphosphatase
VAERVTVVVHGRVQGVGFRYFVQRAAAPLGLVGTVRNLRDGTVEIVAEGTREALDQLLDRVRGDDTPGFVGRVATTWSAPTGEFARFDIL